MKHNALFIGVALALVALLILLTDPFMLWMPAMAAMLALLTLTVLICVWSAFILREEMRDEREILHRMHAGRIAYLSGTSILTLALVAQALIDHHIDPWIGAALAVMVISKLGARIYVDAHE